MSRTDPVALQLRLAGILLHPTSLPGPWRCGNLGSATDDFLGFLHASGLHVWQTLPLGPPDRYRCPYQASSVFAGDPELISAERLADDGLLQASETAPEHPGVSNHAVLGRAAVRFFASDSSYLHNEYAAFMDAQADWLGDYALYTALQDEAPGMPWYLWPPPLRDRDATAMERARTRLADQIRLTCFKQFVFFRQWHRLKARANAAGIALFGDAPLFAAYASADTWSHRDYFCLHADGTLQTATGVPPDYFSSTGQYWGSPAYRWDQLARTHYGWWARRLQHLGTLFDLVRLDHFRGLAAFWAIPGDTHDARRGAWVAGPGQDLFAAMGPADTLPLLVAEDLGDITADVIALRQALRLPGMRVLQFAFDGSPDNPHLPVHHESNSVAYTGTHDNNTTVGWWQSLDAPTRAHVQRTLGNPAKAMPWPLIDAALASPAFMAVVPMQDWLTLDGASRMNTPGQAAGNWGWRLQPGQVNAALAASVHTRLARCERLASWPTADVTELRNAAVSPRK